jgi:toxin ParE1/3/4
VRVVWSLGAVRDLRRAHKDIADFNPITAARVATTPRDAADSLVHSPDRGRPVHGTDLRELVTRHDYLIRYRPGADAVEILRIRHTARRPISP